MKIAVTAEGQDLDARVDPRFGRCQYFLIVETDDLTFEAVANPNVAVGGGAGIQSAQMLAERGVQTVLTGNCGPNAYQTLSAAGIPVIVGVSGTAREAVEQFKTGAYPTAGGANVPSHFGTGGAQPGAPGPAGGGGGAAPAMGPGMGMGRGMGRGRGRGMGGGMGGGGMAGPAGPAQAPPSREQELDMLRQQAQAMQQQLAQIMNRIQELGG